MVSLLTAQSVYLKYKNGDRSQAIAFSIYSRVRKDRPPRKSMGGLISSFVTHTQ